MLKLVSCMHTFHHDILSINSPTQYTKNTHSIKESQFTKADALLDSFLIAVNHFDCCRLIPGCSKGKTLLFE